MWCENCWWAWSASVCHCISCCRLESWTLPLIGVDAWLIYHLNMNIETNQNSNRLHDITNILRPNCVYNHVFTFPLSKKWCSGYHCRLGARRWRASQNLPVWSACFPLCLIGLSPGIPPGLPPTVHKYAREWNIYLYPNNIAITAKDNSYFVIKHLISCHSNPAAMSV